MKVRLIIQDSIDSYAKNNANSRSAFENWCTTVKGARWNNINDIKETFNTADPLGNNSDRIVFDVGGNNYRMICKYHFGKDYVHLFIKWIGTHAEYDKLCKKNLQYSVDDFD